MLIPGSPEKSDVALAKQITALEAELKSRPTDLEVLLRLGKLFHQQGTFQKSIPLFERIIVLRPRHLEAHILLGMDRFHAGRVREAIDSLQRAVELDSLNAEANFYLGLCFLSLDREDEATKVAGTGHGGRTLPPDKSLFTVVFGHVKPAGNAGGELVSNASGSRRVLRFAEQS